MTERQATPAGDDHSSEVGGSTAARRIGCPDSRHLEKQAPKSRGSVYAREGTALHELMAKVLVLFMTDEQIAAELPYTFKGTDYGHDGEVLEHWSHTIDADDWERLGAPALAMWEAFAEDIETSEGSEMHLFIEVKGAFPGIPGAFGTSDVLWRCGKLAGCWDWKFGRGPVSAVDNKQLQFYMNTGIYEKPEFFEGVEEFVLCICQPQVNDTEHSEDVVTMQDLIEFREELQRAMTSSGMQEGPWCKFADCALICPLKTGKTAKLGALLEKLETKRDAPDFDLKDFMVEALDLMDAAQEWSAKVASMAQQMIDEGQMDIPGWKTVDKKSSGRVWTVDDDKARGLMQRRGLKIDEYAPRKTISAPQAITKLKKLGKELPEDTYEMKPSSGTTLVREGDPRPSARTPATRSADLAAGLAKMADKLKQEESN